MNDRLNVIVFHVIYESPKDFPCMFVLRTHTLDAQYGSVTVDCDCMVRPTLEAIRDCVPPGLTNVGRFEQDDPCIKEVWV